MLYHLIRPFHFFFMQRHLRKTCLRKRYVTQSLESFTFSTSIPLFWMVPLVGQGTTVALRWWQVCLCAVKWTKTSCEREGRITYGTWENPRRLRCNQSCNVPTSFWAVSLESTLHTCAPVFRLCSHHPSILLPQVLGLAHRYTSLLTMLPPHHLLVPT